LYAEVIRDSLFKILCKPLDREIPQNKEIENGGRIFGRICILDKVQAYS
jgi:hypothetical protein